MGFAVFQAWCEDAVVASAMLYGALVLPSRGWFEPLGLTENAATWVACSAALLLFVAYLRLQAPLILDRPPNKPRKNRGQKPTEYPPPFPNGWFGICPGDELRRGDVKALDVLGKNLVMFRDNVGKVAILDAFCPHLGAHLGEGGYISDSNCLTCPFHGWEFDANGVCRRVAGTSRVPAGSTLRSWPVCEANGMVLLWHDAEGREPSFAIACDAEVVEGRWYRAGVTKCNVNAHIQELPENGADSAHLNILHKAFVWSPATKAGLSHSWAAEWKPSADAKHVSEIFLTQGAQLLGVDLPGTHIPATINQVGPGIVRLQLSTPIGAVVAYEYVTPLKTTTQRVHHVMYCSPTIPRFVGKFFLWALESQFHRDLPIWERKKYQSRPLISKADGPILAFRRWYSQFYSERSTAMADAVAQENMLDW